MAATKKDLVKAVHLLLKDEELNINAEDCSKVVNAVLYSIIALTGENGKLKLIDFGSFEVKNRKERIGRNPRTGEEIKIPPTKSPTFTAGKAFKLFVK